MIAQQLNNAPQRSLTWFEQRKGRVTGSIVGAILGVAPYMTRADAMRSMVRASLGEPSEFQGNVATEWGTANEATAIADFEFETGLEVVPAPFVPFEDWLGASPDGYTGDDALIEVKCPYGLRKDTDPQFKSIQDQPHYYGQIQVQLYVTHREMCHFWQWTPHGHKLEYVPLDPSWLNENLPILRQFYAEYLHELEHNADEHRAPLRKVIDTPEAHRMIAEYDEITEQMALLKERQDDLKDELITLAGDKNALIAGRKFTKIEKQGAVSYAKAIKELCPDADLEKWRGKPSVGWKLT